MSQPAGPATLLEELLAATSDRRVDLLRSGVSPDEALLALGDEAERLAFAEPGRAVVAAEMVVNLADALGAPRTRARSRRAHAQTLAYAGRFSEALARCEDGAAIAGAAGERVEAARARLASIHALASLGRFEEALAAGEAARRAFVDSGDPALAGRADMNLGAVYAMRDDPRAALVHLDRARAELAGDALLVAQIESNRGNALMTLDDFSAAEDAFTRAAAAFEHGGHTLGAAIAEGNLAYLATRQGHLQSALLHFEQARRLLERDEARAHLTRLLAEQAGAMLALGLPHDAAVTFEAILSDLEDQGLAVELAQARAGLGQALLRSGRLTEAEAPLIAAAADFASRGQPTARARVDLIHAELLAAHGNHASARALAEAALADLAERPAESAAAYAFVASLALQTGDHAAAEAALATGFALAERLGLSPVLATLRQLRARLLHVAGKIEPALDNLRDAVAEIERIRGTLQAERFRAAYLGARLDAYEELALLALESPPEDGQAEAFATIERCKSRALLDLLAAEDVSGVEPVDRAGIAEHEMLAELARRRAQLNWNYSRLANAGPGDAPGDSETRAALIAAENAVERLEYRLAATRDPSHVLASVSLEEARASLPSGAALLEYFIAGDEILAFVIREETTQVYRGLATVGNLDERLRRFRFQIGRALATKEIEGLRTERLFRDARQELKHLGEALIAPIKPALTGVSQLIVIPHGMLHAVPFHAIRDDGGDLIDSFELTYAPSASVFARLAHRPAFNQSDGLPVVVGVSDEFTPGILEEVEKVRSAIGRACALTESRATADRVIAATASTPLLHVACHGRFSPDHPATSGLKLHDRWLTPREIAALRLHGAHVTLSAFDTGRSSVAAGDELLGLARAFLSAGASSLLMSLWPVHDETASTLMSHFYRRLRAGDSRPRAFRAAQLACRAERPHPAFWAPFFLGGRP